MITNGLLFLLYMIVLILTRPLLLFPDVSIESGFGSAIATATSYLANFNQILPLTTLFQIIGLIIIIEIAISGYKIVMWIIKKIPGVN